MNNFILSRREIDLLEYKLNIANNFLLCLYTEESISTNTYEYLTEIISNTINSISEINIAGKKGQIFEWMDEK